MPSDTSVPQNPLHPGISRLASLGLNLFASFPYALLPSEQRSSLKECYPEANGNTHIIIIGHGGTHLWNQIRHELNSSPDPIDTYSRKSLSRFCQQLLGHGQYRILYPGEENPPLQQLGQIAGWHNPSPLGIGINSEWGLWYAYRAMAVTEHPLPTISSPLQASPCDSCNGDFCVLACPAEAVNRKSGLNLKRCADFRLRRRSPCADSCPARMACPVQAKHRYSSEQLRYHYQNSLETLRSFYAKKS